MHVVRTAEASSISSDEVAVRIHEALTDASDRLRYLIGNDIYTLTRCFYAADQAERTAVPVDIPLADAEDGPAAELPTPTGR